MQNIWPYKEIWNEKETKKSFLKSSIWTKFIQLERVFRTPELRSAELPLEETVFAAQKNW